MSSGNFIFFMAVLAISIYCWKAAVRLFKAVRIIAILPKILALTMAPKAIAIATKAI